MKKIKKYLHQFIKDFWNTLRIIFSDDQTLSSKRIFGAIILVYVLVDVHVFIATDLDISSNELNILNSLLLVGALLVSGDSIKEVLKHFKSNKDGQLPNS